MHLKKTPLLVDTWCYCGYRQIKSYTKVDASELFLLGYRIYLIISQLFQHIFYAEKAPLGL